MTTTQADQLIAIGQFLADGTIVGLATAFVCLGWYLGSFFMRERSSLIGRDLD